MRKRIGVGLLAVILLVLFSGTAFGLQRIIHKQYQTIGLVLTIDAPDPAYPPLTIPLGKMRLRSETAGPFLLRVYLPKSRLATGSTVLTINTITHQWTLRRGKKVLARSK